MITELKRNEIDSVSGGLSYEVNSIETAMTFFAVKIGKKIIGTYFAFLKMHKDSDKSYWELTKEFTRQYFPLTWKEKLIIDEKIFGEITNSTATESNSISHVI